jgi:hypothetical protein
MFRLPLQVRVDARTDRGYLTVRGEDRASAPQGLICISVSYRARTTDSGFVSLVLGFRPGARARHVTRRGTRNEN